MLIIFTAPTLLGIFVSIPGGVLGDRFGPRLIVGSGALISAVSGFLRAFSPDFASEFAVGHDGAGLSSAISPIRKKWRSGL